MRAAGKLAKRLTIMYAFALTCIAVAAVGAYLVLQWGLALEADNANRINMSGHQRMVAQRIMALSSRSFSVGSEEEVAVLSREILGYLEQLETAHETLAHDYDPDGRLVTLPASHDIDRGGWTTSLPDESLALYHGVGGLDELVGSYGSLVRAAVATPLEQRHSESSLLAQINALADGRLAEQLEVAVLEERLEAERDMARLYLIERAILGATLVLLFLECCFIFLPTIGAVRSAVQDEQRQADKLRSEVGEKVNVIEELTKARKNLEKLSIVPKYSRDGTVILNHLGRIEWVNPVFCKLSGWEMGEVVGRVPSEVLAGSVALEEFEREVANSLGDSNAWQREVEIKTRSGEEIWVDVGVNTVKGQGLHAMQMVAVFRDITETVRRRKMLEDSNAKADAANLAKTQFLANMSHEIRTPMNGILGMNYLLLHTDLDSEQKEYAETVQASSEHLLSLINNILDLSKLEAGEIEMVRQPFSLSELVDSSLGAVRGIAIQKNLDLSATSDFEKGVQFEGDIDHLRQVLINILGNAVKFTEEGEVSLHVAGTGTSLSLNISDTGVGMTADELPHLFDRFYQVDGSATRKREGSGLGLAICKEIIDHMDGSITVDSDMNQGTTFVIDIPLVQIDQSSDQSTVQNISRSA